MVYHNKYAYEYCKNSKCAHVIPSPISTIFKPRCPPNNNNKSTLNINIIIF